ncbi:MAG TPA: hypothetical protein VFW64_12240 [Pseudonocardiaceae bacterium]|nr:hypothetical protein [Pseudonocardiaceae bacterium]
MATVTNALNASPWQDYLSVADDVKDWLQIGSGDTSRDKNLQMLTSMACDWMQNFLGRPIAPTKYDRRFDGWSGWNGAYIELDLYPVLEIVSVIEYWGVSGPHTLLESSPSNQIDGWQCEYLVGRLIRVFPGNVQKPWFPGSRNVEVTWVAGYNPVPTDIKIATLELVAHWFRNTQQQRAVSTSVEVDYDAADTQGMFAGVPNRIKDLVSPYLQVGLG